MQQLELFPSPKIRSPPNGRTSEQELAFQQILADARQQRAELEAIGKSLYPDFDTMLTCPHDRYIKVCIMWHKSKGRDISTADLTVYWQSTPLTKPRRTWSIEAKRSNRLLRLHQRIAKKFSIPEFFHQAIQEKVLAHPNYFGVCPLPSELTCKYYPPYHSKS
jgi:hypothetical protein